MPGVMNTMPQPKEGSRGRCEAEKPPVHGPSGYQLATTRTCINTTAIADRCWPKADPGPQVTGIPAPEAWGSGGSAPGPAPQTGAAKLAEGRRAAPANRPNWPKANAAAPVTRPPPT